MEIVELNINDLSKIEQLLQEQFGSEAWNRSQIESSYYNPSTKFYGILAGEGLACVCILLESIDDINILYIATDNRHKRMGYAKAMINFIFGLLKEGQSMSLEVKSKNLPAIRLYESFGFKTLNVRKSYYKDGDDALCMFLK